MISAKLILRNAGIPSLDIFLHADVNLRKEHIQKLGLKGKEDPRKYLTKMDNLRETYFKTYTKHELGTYHDQYPPGNIRFWQQPVLQNPDRNMGYQAYLKLLMQYCVPRHQTPG